MKKSALILILFLNTAACFSQVFSAEDKKQIDSLNRIIDSPAIPDSSRANAYVSLSEILYISNLDTVDYLSEKAILIAERNLAKQNLADKEKKFFQKVIAGALNNLSYASNNRGDVAKALEYNEKSLKINREIGNRRGIATALNNMGTIYENQGDIPKALKYYHESLKIQEKIGDSEGMAASMNNIGFVYCYQGDFDKGLEYYQKSMVIQKKAGNKYGIAVSLNNIGGIYDDKKNYEKALEYYNKSLAIQEEISDIQGIAISLNNIGMIYCNKAKALLKTLRGAEQISGNTESNFLFNKSLEYLYKSLELQVKTGDKNGVTTLLHNIGTISFQLGNITEAKQSTIRSLEIAREINFPEKIRNAAELLSKIYKKEGNYKAALKNYELYVEMDDSTRNRENEKNAVRQQARYEYEKKAAADSTKVAEERKVSDALMEAKEAEVRNRTYQVIVLFLLAIVGFVVTVFFVIRTRLRQKIQDEKLHVHLIKQDRLKEQLEFKNKELVSNSIFLSKKNQVLFSVSEQLRDIQKKADESNAHELDQVIKQLERDSNEKSWEAFEKRFLEVYTDFFEKIGKRYSSLTPNEIKLCAFLKLNMSTKEISEITHQSTRAIEVARHRLRKKLELDRDENLVSLLSRL